MTRMTTRAILPLALGALIAGAGSASAQAMSFKGIDANQDGVLDMIELEATFGPNAELAMQQYDVNRDGMVEVEEAEAVSLRGTVTDDASSDGSDDEAMEQDDGSDDMSDDDRADMSDDSDMSDGDEGGDHDDNDDDGEDRDDES